MVIPRRVAIIGAGISGLACARTLLDSGVHAVILDKARGSGGRTSTRRGEAAAFDHGAQYFTARDEDFAQHVRDWQREGVVAEWTGEIVTLRNGEISATTPTPRYVGVPGMSSVVRHLATPCPPLLSFRVATIRRSGGQLEVLAEDGRRESGFDAVVLATPAPQTAALAQPVAPALASTAGAVSFEPCWAAMLTFDRRWPVEFDGAFVEDSPLSWVARNSSKPQRPERECWVLHGSPAWSRENFDDVSDNVIHQLSVALSRAATTPLPTRVEGTAHRWAYALPTQPLAESCLLDAEAGVGACGDWCAGPRVEGAFLSGVAMARRLLSETAL